MRMQYESCMVVKILVVNPRLIGNECLISTRLNRHKTQQIKLELHEQHNTLCYEYKNAMSLEEANVCYATI
jgi:hypothetical protein